MKLILNEDEPIFIQISKAIEDEILTDSIKEDEQVPSTTELSRLYNINPATVLKGMNILVDKNILYKKRGLGMFVNRGAKNTIKLLRKESFKNSKKMYKVVCSNCGGEAVVPFEPKGDRPVLCSKCFEESKNQ